MTYNKPQHSGEHSCTPFPILREGDTSGIVTYIDLVKLGNIDSFGVDLTKLGGNKRWDNSSITTWEVLFEAIDAHLKLFDEKLAYLEDVVFPDNIIINVDTDNQTLTANVDDVTWSSNSAAIIVNPTIGKTTTYFLKSGLITGVEPTWRLSVNKSQINLGESVIINVTWEPSSKEYNATITASKSGMTSATQNVSLTQTSTNPGYVTLDNGLGTTLHLDNNGEITGRINFTPTQAGVYQIRIKDLEPGYSPSVTITVIDTTQVTYNGLCQLILKDGSTVELGGYGIYELQQSMVNPYLTTTVKANIGITCRSIGDNAFSGCTELTNVTISKTVTNIGTFIFNNCTNLASIIVASDNTVYDSRNNCNAIIETETNILVQGCKTTIIPDNVTRIGSNAFSRCTSLTSIDIPDSVTSIGDNAFIDCSGLTNVTIPDSVINIGDVAFGDCTGLTSVTIPNSVINIGGNAFNACTGLTNVIIGNGVTSIGHNAFIGCSSLTTISSLATTAPTIYNSTFQDVKTGGVLTVPSGSTGYDTWMSTEDYYLGKYNWNIDEQGGDTSESSYYWYGGAGPIDSSTVPGKGDGWHAIPGTPMRIDTGDLENSTKIHWILAVPAKFGLNRISNGEDITDIYDVSTVTCADGVQYKVFRQLSETKRTNVSIIVGAADSTTVDDYGKTGMKPV